MADLRSILVVDDDQRLSSLAEDFLHRNGFQVTVAATGEEALGRLNAQDFDLITLDLMLPDVDGLEVCRRIRARSDHRRSVPVLMLTARAETVDRIVGLEIGADDYLPKPFEPRELLARIRALLRRPPLAGGRADAIRSESDILRFGSLDIDRGAREVRLHGKVCPLTAHQFTVLMTLAERAGRAVSREDLMLALGPASNDTGLRAIDIHVARIRAAIEDESETPRRIQTVRGSGYLFVRDQA